MTKRASDADAETQPERPAAPIRNPVLRTNHENHESRLSGLVRDVIVYLLDPMCREGPGELMPWDRTSKFSLTTLSFVPGATADASGEWASERIMHTCMLTGGALAYALIREAKGRIRFRIAVGHPDFNPPGYAYSWKPPCALTPRCLVGLPGNRVGVLDTTMQCLRSYRPDGTKVGVFWFREDRGLAGFLVGPPVCGAASPHGMIMVCTRSPGTNALTMWALTPDLAHHAHGPMVDGFLMSAHTPPVVANSDDIHGMAASADGFTISSGTSLRVYTNDGAVTREDCDPHAPIPAYDSSGQQLGVFSRFTATSVGLVRLADVHGKWHHTGISLGGVASSKLAADTARALAIDRLGRIVISRERDVLILTPIAK